MAAPSSQVCIYLEGRDREVLGIWICTRCSQSQSPLIALVGNPGLKVFPRPRDRELSLCQALHFLPRPWGQGPHTRRVDYITQ